MSSETELEIIDRLGVLTVADELGLSREGVRKWRVKGNVPEHRREEIRNLGAKHTSNAGQPTWHDVPTNLPMVVVQPPTGQPGALIDLGDIVGPDARAKVEAAIAERQAELAGDEVDTMRRVSMLTADRPVRGYGLRLAGLFALDFPVLTMAFASVAQVSPIVAAGSAIALSLFLVAGAHLLGGVLRKAVIHLPRWCRDLLLLVILIGFLAAIVAVTWDLRMQGLDLDTIGRVGDQALIFGTGDATSSELPASLRSTIGRAAALVTIGSLLFGVAWSYRQHGPRAIWQKAEQAYRRKLRRLARMRARMAKTQKTAARIASRVATITVAAIGLTLIGADQGEAATCSGGTVVALIDTTTAYDETDRAAIMPTIDTMAASLQPDQRLVIRTVRDAPTSRWLLFDGCMPEDPGISWSASSLWRWLTTNQSAARARRDAFFAEIRAALLPALDGQGSAARTALVGTVDQVVAEVDHLEAVWLFSDLLESSALPAESLLGRSPQVLVDAAPSLPRLDGVPVHVAGFGRWHDAGRRSLDGEELASLIDAWTVLIASAGGELRLEGANARLGRAQVAR